MDEPSPPLKPDNTLGPVLITGATGYIGGRLAPRLLARGYRIHCLARSIEKLKVRPWASDPRVQAFEGDLDDTEALARALEGCRSAYYLVHSMTAVGPAYRSRDLELARTFGRAATAAGVGRIVYLGGLGETGEGLSEHLSSRREVEEALGEGGTAVTVLRAAMIIGSGSASFEILRYLVERLPVMVTPRWVSTECQPIAVRDVLHYLVAVLDVPETAGRVLDVGGPDVVSYRTMMDVMAKELGLRRRLVVPVPVLTPYLSSLWIHLVTPLPASIARPLAEGLRNRVVCRDDEVRRLMPHECLGVREAIRQALAHRAAGTIETTWADAGVIPGDPEWAGGTVYTDRREAQTSAGEARLWEVICSLGGETGYYGANWLWRLRGSLDKLVGGPGLRRGRRHPAELRLGDTVDFWRVASVQPRSRLVLVAEMRLPGEAILILETVPPGLPDGPRTVVLTARFRPRGLLGILYWWAVWPLHGVVFRGMLRGIVRAAEQPPKV